MKKINAKNKLFEKIVKYNLECMIELLKDDIRNKAVFIIDEGEPPKSGNEITRARVEYITNPPIVRFYVSAIAWTNFVNLIEDLQKLMRHEIAHVLGIRDEKGANQNDRRLNIFKDVK